MSNYQTYSKGGICDSCNKTIGPGEGYMIPVSIFYSSAQYKKSIAGLAAFAGMTADQFISHMRSQDQTTHSVVCKDCLGMFE